MLKAVVNKETGVNIEITGSILDTIRYITAIIHAVYSILSKQGTIEGKAFRTILVGILKDNECPVWELDDAEPSVVVDLAELAKQLREE